MSGTPIGTPGGRAAGAIRSNVLTFPLIAAAALGAAVAVARALPLEQFALYAVAIALRSTIQFLADLGTGAASSRAFAELERSGTRRQGRKLYRRLAAIRVGLLALLAAAVLLAPQASADLLGLRASERYFLGMVLAIGAAEVASALGFYVLSGTFQQRVINRVVLAQNLLQPALVISAVAAGLGLRGILGAVVAVSAAKALALNLVALRTVGRFAETGDELSDVGRSYIRVAGSSILGKLASWIHSRQVVSVIAVASVPRAALAVFALAYDFVHQVLSTAVTPASGVALPTFSAVKGDRDAARRLLRQATRGLALTVLPATAALVAALPALIHVLFGERYEAGVLYGLIIAPALALELVLAIPVSALMLADDALLGPFAKVKTALIAFGAIYLLTPVVGLLPVTAAMMTIRAGAAVALHVVVRRRLRFDLEPLWLLRCLLVAAAACAAGGAAGLAVPGRIADVVVIPLVSLAVFAVLVRAARLLVPADAALVRRILPGAAPVVRLLAGGAERGRDAGSTGSRAGAQ